tara:strand:+ start:124 stop:912 length:789 start_codon:yes stop_codon:yes gene_type:complete
MAGAPVSTKPDPQETNTNQFAFQTDDPVLATSLEITSFLTYGDLEILTRMPWSSNQTFLVNVTQNNKTIQGVYKPGKGERTLHDFPPNLYKREVAAYKLAQTLEWDLVPPTILRDGPFGEGSVQLYIPCDYNKHYFTVRDNPNSAYEITRLAAFDLIANNADRKAGHVLVDPNDHLWAVDNALCFHHQFKIRTVIWDFAGTALPKNLLEDLTRFIDVDISQDLTDLLTNLEIDALITRTKALMKEKYLPSDPSGQRIPWPIL